MRLFISSVTLMLACNHAYSQNIIELSDRTLQGFWHTCEVDCDDPNECLSNEDSLLEWFSGDGISVFFTRQSIDDDQVSRVRARVKDITISDDGVFYHPNSPSEDGFTWQIDEFTLNRASNVNNGKVYHTCRLETPDETLSLVSNYFSALGEKFKAPEMRDVNFTIWGDENYIEIMVPLTEVAEPSAVINTYVKTDLNIWFYRTREQQAPATIDVDGDGLPEFFTHGERTVVAIGTEIPISDQEFLVRKLKP